MSIEILPQEYELLERVARRAAQRYSGYAEYDDLYQEGALWICENQPRLAEWREQEDGGVKAIATSLRRRMGNYARRERAAWRRSLTPQQVAENYTAKQVRAALPYALTGLPLPGSVPAAIVADIKSAYEKLDWKDQGVIRAAVVYDYDYDAVAKAYSDADVSLTPNAAAVRVSRAIKRLAKTINTPSDQQWIEQQWKKVPRRSSAAIIRNQQGDYYEHPNSSPGTHDRRDDLH